MSEVEIERMVVRIVGDAVNYINTLNKVQNETKKAGKQVEEDAKKVEVFGKVIDQLGAGMSNFAGSMSAFRAIQQPFETLKESVGLAGDMEQLQIAFTTIIGSADKAKATLADLVQFADTTPFEMPEIANAAKQMIAMGTAASDIVPTMRMLGDIAAGLGLRLGDLTYIYGTLQSQGRAFTQDINQFAMRGIPIWAELEKIFGLNNAQVRELVEKGKVGFKDVEKAFQNMTKEGGRFFGMTEQQSKSFNGMMSTMQDSIAGVMRTIGFNVIELFKLKEGLDLVTQLAKGFDETLNTMNPTLKGTITLIASLTAGSAALIVVWKVGAIGVGMVVGVLKDMVVTLRWIVPAVWAWVSAMFGAKGAALITTTAVNGLLAAQAAYQKGIWATITASKALSAVLVAGIAYGVMEATFAIAGGNKALRDLNAEMERSKVLNDLLAGREAGKHASVLELANSKSGADRITFLQEASAAANKQVADLAMSLESVKASNAGAGEGLLDNFLFDAKDIPFFGEGLEQEAKMASEQIKEFEDRLNAAKKRADELHQALAKATKAPEENAEVVKAVTDLTDRLSMQAQTWGMSAREADIYRAKVLGATDAQLLAARQWNVYLSIMEAAKKASEEMRKTEQKRLDDLMEEGRKMMEESRTPEQILQDEMAKLNTLFAVGAIGLDLYLSALAQAEKTFQDTSKEASKTTKELEKLDGAMKGSAEAKFRIQQFRERNAVARTPVGPSDKVTDMVKLLGQIAISTAAMVNKPTLAVVPAGLGEK